MTIIMREKEEGLNHFKGTMKEQPINILLSDHAVT